MAQINIADLLDFYNFAVLTTMASFHGVLPKQSKTKKLLIQLLSEVLVEPQRIQRSLAALKPAERALLDAILRRDEKVSARNLRQEMAGAHLVDLKAIVEYNEYSANRPDPRRENSRRFEDLLARLMLTGLVFSADEMDEPDPAVVPKINLSSSINTVFVPPQIRRYLPAPAPLPPVSEHEPAVQVVREASARVFQRELFLYWGFVRDKQPGLTAKGELLKKSLKDVNSLLLAKESIETGATELSYPRLVFLRQVLEKLDLVRYLDSNVLIHGSDTGFFALPPAERVKKSLQAWLDQHFAVELLLLPEEHRPKPAQILEIRSYRPLINARRFILNQLKALAPKGWVRLMRLVDRIRDENYEFFLVRPKRSQYYYSPPHPYEVSTNTLQVTFPGIYREDDGWEKVEARLIQAVVTGPLHWLGLVDLGWTGEATGTPTAFRLTALGKWLLDLGPQPEIPSEGGKIIVQPNLHIIALDPIQEATLVVLDRFAERLSAERAVEYQLTRQSVYAAQQTGLDAGQIKNILEQHTGSALPGNVVRTLDEWQLQYERIVIRPHVSLAFGEVTALDKLINSRSAKDWTVMRPLREVVVLSNPKALGRAAEALRALGIYPLQISKPEIPPNSVHSTAGGDLQFTGRFRSLYLHGHLAQFAERIDSGYRITAGSVSRAVRRGLTAPEIINWLQAVHVGPLPEELALRIRAWCKHYGDAVLEEVILLQVEDDKILAELSADAEIGPLLESFKPEPTRALARVRPEHLVKLRSLLAERGIDIFNKLK